MSGSERIKAQVAADCRVELMESWIVRRLAASSIKLVRWWASLNDLWRIFIYAFRVAAMQEISFESCN